MKFYVYKIPSDLIQFNISFSVNSFFFVMNLNSSSNPFITFKFCLSRSSFVFFFKISNSLYMIYPSFLRFSIMSFLGLLIKCSFNLYFPKKSRLRFSGLGYGVDFIDLTRQLKINVGFTAPPLISIPFFVKDIIINKKKKKILITSFFSFFLNSFSSKIRKFKPCDVYKRKGIRWRFEKIKTKLGKRSGKR